MEVRLSGQTQNLGPMRRRRYSNCESKRRFDSVRDAIQAADRYMDRITLTNGPMVPYYCPVHSTWHIGHNKRVSHTSVVEYVGRCVQRERLRNEISGLELLVQSNLDLMPEAA